MTAGPLVEHFFRHEYGRLVATLVRRFGPENLDVIEDAVQSSLLKALGAWTSGSTPDNHSAWLHRVAHNEVLGTLRTRAGHRQILLRSTGDLSPAPEEAAPVYFAEEVQDDTLRMLFACCDGEIAEDCQLALALKTLCGFSVSEISVRLFASEAAIYKRLARARARLRGLKRDFAACDADGSAARLPAVIRILYVMFTEGYLSSHEQRAIRLELCQEALRLAELLAHHPTGRDPQTHALLALMHLHLARTKAREDASGELLLLEEQDRAKWDRQHIQMGLSWLASSARGETFSRYHAEAGVAAEHCLAPSYSQTNWRRVVECYELLERFEPSALHRLNRAIAVGEWQGAEEGLAVLDGYRPPTWLEGSYLWAAVQADLNRRSGRLEQAALYADNALRAAPTSAIRATLARRLQKT